MHNAGSLEGVIHTLPNFSLVVQNAVQPKLTIFFKISKEKNWVFEVAIMVEIGPSPIRCSCTIHATRSEQLFGPRGEPKHDSQIATQSTPFDLWISWNLESNTDLSNKAGLPTPQVEPELSQPPLQHL